MPHPHLEAANGRRFAAFAAAVFALVVDPSTRRFLVMSSPAKRGRPGWETINGGVEAGETLTDAVLREVAEEAGPDLAIELLGAVDAWTYHYDDLVPNMISVAFAARFIGGDVVPGDDMAGCEVRWLTIEELRELEAAGTPLTPDNLSAFERALSFLLDS